MHITQLDIDNFKSFGRKTRIPFYPGFTVISGPNGSGKSNIIDSILFVLALSSSRSLRAEKLTDLLNLNSGKNTAEVEITFSDGTNIKRRIKRTGTSYYNYIYLNGKPSRQGDVLDFLSGRGIVPHGYNVVMQGDINRIIEMSDTERRKVIDEIAGVAEFDSKKALSYEELGHVRERIQEESAHLDELQVRLNQLAKQREEAVQYKILLDELKHLTLSRFAALLNIRESELNALEEGVVEDREVLSTCDADISWASHERDFVKEEISRIDREISQKTGSEYMALVSRIAEAKAAIDGYENSISRVQRDKEENSHRLSDIFATVKKQEERHNEKEGEIRELLIDRTNLSMTVASVKKEWERLQKEISEKSLEQQDDEERLRNLRDQVSSIKDTRGDLLRKQDLLIERSRMRNAEESRIQSRIHATEREIISKKEKIEAHLSDISRLKDRKKELDRSIGQFDTSLYAKRDSHEVLLKKMRDLRQEINKKEAHQQAQGRYNRALEAVLGMEGVFGTIADLATCNPQYAIALNIAAGAKLHFVIVENDQIASEAIQYLKDHNLGRATFLPLNKLRAKPLPSLPSGPDIVGFATDLLEYDYRFEEAFRVVFGSTLIVDSLQHARRRVGEFRMVTLDGSLLEKSGTMTGGSIKRDISGFGQSSEDELRKLNAELSALTVEEQILSESMTTLSADRDRVQQERIVMESDLARIGASSDSLIHNVQTLEDDIRSLSDQLEQTNAESGDSSEDLVSLEQQIHDLNDRLGILAHDISKISSRLEETGIPILFDQLDQAGKQLEESERRLRNKENDITESQRERSYILKVIEDKRIEMERIRANNLRFDEEIKQYETAIGKKREEISLSQETVDRMTEVISDLQEERNGFSLKADSFETRVRELTAKKERISVRIESIEDKIRLLSAEIATLVVESAGIETIMSLEEIDQDLLKTQQEVDRMGDVNMRAIEEYDQVDAVAKERQERLSVLERELSEIKERIEFFSRKKYEAFMSAFSAIDNNFRDIFSRLTMGTGMLHLENEEDPFSGGLSFAVQPRDKKVHHLAALSGGEKSLTTLAFIFSIQKYIPAPFYAFDEVDMNLDGANVERIAEMIRDLSSTSQFINISLRKPMIDAADRIIGVTIRPDKSTLVTGVSMDD